MNNKHCDRFIVLGCGHTGTTLISGILHRSGFWGCDVECHYEPLPLTALCVQIMATKGVISQSLEGDIVKYFNNLERQSGGKWTLKDPRLSDVIDVLSRYIPKPYKIVFNYRHPAPTIKHLMVYDKGDLNIERKKNACEEEYIRRNTKTIEFIEDHPEIQTLYVRYDDLVDRKLDDIINRFVGKILDFDFVNPRKRKSPPVDTSFETLKLYEEINDRYYVCVRSIIVDSSPMMRKNPFIFFWSFFSSTKHYLTKVKWRVMDKTIALPVSWRVRQTFKKKYDWAAYSKMIDLSSRDQDNRF